MRVNWINIEIEAMEVAKGIISEEQAEEYGWLEKSYRSNDFLARYNKHQKYLNGKDDGELFVCDIDEVLPKFLVNADLRGAHLKGADLRGAHLEGAHLEGAYLTSTYLGDAHLEDVNLKNAHLQDAHLQDVNLKNAHLQGAHLGAVSLLEETGIWQDVDFTNVRLWSDGDLLTPEKSLPIIIKRMVELEIINAKGLGDDYTEALRKSNLISEDTVIDASQNDVTSEAGIAPSLAKSGFTVVANMPSGAQIDKIRNEPVQERPLEAPEL